MKETEQERTMREKKEYMREVELFISLHGRDGTMKEIEEFIRERDEYKERIISEANALAGNAKKSLEVKFDDNKYRFCKYYYIHNWRCPGPLFALLIWFSMPLHVLWELKSYIAVIILLYSIMWVAHTFTLEFTIFLAVCHVLILDKVGLLNWLAKRSHSKAK